MSMLAASNIDGDVHADCRGGTMAGLSAQFVDGLLLAGRAGTRFLNEGSVQPSVWTRFATKPSEPVDLLLLPHDDTSSAKLARYLHERISEMRDTDSGLTPIDGSVAVKVDFDTFVQVILPATGFDIASRSADLFAILRLPKPGSSPKKGEMSGISLSDLLAFSIASKGTLKPDLRIALLVHLIWAARGFDSDVPVFLDLDFNDPASAERWRNSPEINEKRWSEATAAVPPKIWRVSENRGVFPLAMSVETIKADAAMRVFEIDCSSITWAVIDSGIDGSHPAFRDHKAGDFSIRVDKAYDFTRLREWVSYGSLSNVDKKRQAVIDISSKLLISESAAADLMAKLHQDMLNGRPFDWDVLSRVLETRPDKLDSSGQDNVEGHGTHVAGVLAADWRENEMAVLRGVCPTLRLYDLRVLGATAEDTEFAVIAALAFVRWLNSHNRYMIIHGVNLSIGLDHDKANFACGSTPVCLACDATVSSGVVVVAAAGNYGSQSYSTMNGAYAAYATVSIADPGNAECVITVGSTHRERPHEYGVSFFSSRGPTGDGRMKPDLVAPGERIDGPLPNLGFGKLDGTSMAAPHVSGVAAMLLARHQELIGKPGRVKSILTDSATDLRRERSFQGAGLVDALRALQSI